MPLRSDITINAAQFDPVAIPRATAELNEHLIELGKRGPRWWEVCGTAARFTDKFAAKLEIGRPGEVQGDEMEQPDASTAAANDRVRCKLYNSLTRQREGAACEDVHPGKGRAEGHYDAHAQRRICLDV